jgi:hypothetical protein
MTYGTGKQVGGDEAGPAATLDAARPLGTRQRTTWPRRRLSGRVAGLFWLLRLYVVGMLAVIAVQLARLV